MIFKDLKIFLQNVQKNNLIVSTILKLKADFDIIFIKNQLDQPFIQFLALGIVKENL